MNSRFLNSQPNLPTPRIFLRKLRIFPVNAITSLLKTGSFQIERASVCSNHIQILTIGLIGISLIATILVWIMWEQEPTGGGLQVGPPLPHGEPGTGQLPTIMMTEDMLSL